MLGRQLSQYYGIANVGITVYIYIHIYFILGNVIMTLSFSQQDGQEILLV